MAAWCRLGSVAPLLPGATGYLPPATPHHNPEPKCCYRIDGLLGQTPRAVTKSRCDFPETFPLPTRVPRARLNRGAELNAGGLRVSFEGLPGQPESVQNDGQLASYRDNRLALTTFPAAFGQFAAPTA